MMIVDFITSLYIIIQIFIVFIEVCFENIEINNIFDYIGYFIILLKILINFNRKIFFKGIINYINKN